MVKRELIIGEYRTVADGKWLLTELSLSPPEQATNFVDVPGRRKGPLDLSTALTDGDPVYGSRTLTAVFESSEGTRAEREVRISTMTNWLDGWTQNIVLPDDPRHYLVGRIHVERLYNDLAHASVRVTATCEPWRYNLEETRVELPLSTEEQTVTLVNQGRLALVPLLTTVFTGSNPSSGIAQVLLKSGGASWALEAGVYKLPDLLLTQGSRDLTYSSNVEGSIIFTYREAVL